MRPPALISLLALGQLPPDLKLGLLPAGITLGLASLVKRLERDEALFLSLCRWQQRMFFARAEDADRFIPLFEAQFLGALSTVARCAR